MPEVTVEYLACECGSAVFVTPDGRQFDATPQYVLMAKGDDVFTAEKVWIEHSCDDGLTADELVEVLKPMMQVQCAERDSNGVRCELSAGHDGMHACLKRFERKNDAKKS